MERIERERALRRMAAAAGRIVVFTSTSRSAEGVCERLRLAGVPVLLGTGPMRAVAVEQFAEDNVSSLVVTRSDLEEHGPVTAPLVVHTRVPSSVREYQRRLDLAASPIHVTLVVPEDLALADALASHLDDPYVVDTDDRGPLTAIQDLAGDAAATIAPRRRFPLAR